MKVLSDLVTYINNLPPTKRLILIIIAIVVVIFLVDFIGNSMKSNYRNVTNHSIENMDDSVVNTNHTVHNEDNNSPSDTASNTASNMLPFREVMMNTDILNITLFYADWCGHCKKFMKETWGQLKEKFGSSNDVQLNQIDCTNVKSAIETPAGKSVEGFPTLILNYKDKNGKYVEEEYNGPRSFQVIASVIDKFTE
jgi:thiol-disulfide isomerase/thioredoxin